jgi:hypothetical protein
MNWLVLQEHKLLLRTLWVAMNHAVRTVMVTVTVTVTVDLF